MKTIVFVLCVVFSLSVYAETELELVTGSRFKGEIKKLTSRYIIVDTKIGELKLTLNMLSPVCRASLKASNQQIASGEKLDVDVKVSYRQKTLSKEKDSFRRGAKREYKQKAGILTISFDHLPGGKDYSGRVEYEFTAENRGRKKRGALISFDHGIKSFELKANEINPEVEIQSKSVSHVKASHTGDKLGEGGAELKGYKVKVYLNGNLVHEEEK